MSKETQVTYIKNNVEKTIILNPFTMFLLFKEVCSVKYDYLGEKIYKINKDVEFVHFKNFLFNKVMKIECVSDTLCIFEECTFSKEKLISSILYLGGGIFELVDSVFYNIKEIDVNTFLPTDVNIIYTKKVEQNNNSKITAVIGDRNNFTSKTIIKDENIMNELIVYSKDIYLKNKIQTDVFKIIGDNIIIGGDDVTNITNNTEFSYPPVIGASKKLELKNCCIENNSFLRNRMSIQAPYIEIDNVVISSKYDSIVINDNEFRRKENDKFVVNDLDILRASLMNCLVGRKEQLEMLLDFEVDRILDNVSFLRQQQIEDLKLKIDNKKEELRYLQGELQEMELYLRGAFMKKENAIKKSLSKKSPDYFGK